MNFLDLFFPQQAQAEHLRDIAEATQHQAITLHRERFQREKQRREDDSRIADMEERMAQLERDVGQAGLVIEALLELLEESKTLNRQLLAARAAEIDTRDGKLDHRHTPPEKKSASQQWKGQGLADA